MSKPSPVAESSVVGPEILPEQKQLYVAWESLAYRGAPIKLPMCSVPGFEGENFVRLRSARWREFLAMVKQCECGVWHLGFNAKCSKCEKLKPNERAD